jgi:hypothetical protein
LLLKSKAKKKVKRAGGTPALRNGSYIFYLLPGLFEALPSAQRERLAL